MTTAKCICDWPSDCGGGGVRYCGGCGGDQCVCRCGGEAPCEGCDLCNEPDYADDLEALDCGADE